METDIWKWTDRQLRRLHGATRRLVPAWCRSEYLSKTRILLALAAVPSVLSLARSSELGETAEFAMARRIEFALREVLGPEQLLDARVKAFAFDDESFNFVKGPDLNLKDWALVISALDRAGASRILIDKVFGQPAPSADAAVFNEAVASAHAKVFTGAFIAATPIPGRAAVDLSTAAFDPSRYRPGHLTQTPAGPDDGAFTRSTVYGPTSELLAGLNRLGHLNFSSNGTYYPVAHLDGGRVLFHLSMLAAAGLSLDDAHGPVADGVTLPTDRRGRMLVDFIPPSDLAKRIFSMKALIARARVGRSIDVVAPGDIVVILPRMYTGNADFMDSPYGVVAGGYYLLPCINSVLTGRYLSVPDCWAFAILLACAAGFALAAFCPVKVVWPGLAGAAAAQACAGIAMFLWLRQELPWLFTCVGVCLSGIAVFAERSRIEALQKVRIDTEVATARLVQSLFLSPTDATATGLGIAASFRPASECSGDWFRHVSIDGRYFVILADAMGHGVSAALMTAMAHTSVAACVDAAIRGGPPVTPFALAKQINDIFYQTGKGDLFMSCLVVAFAPDRRSLIYLNAGMPRPILALGPQRGSDQPIASLDRRETPRRRRHQTLEGAGTPLGLFSAFNCQEQTLDVQPGDRLVLFSDGLIEARNKSFKAWGTTFIKRVACREDSPAAHMRDGIVAAFAGHCHGTPPADDATLIVVEVLDDAKGANPGTSGPPPTSRATA